PDGAVGVVQATRHELALVADHRHLVPRLDLPFLAADRPGEDPGMPREEWPGASRLEDYAGGKGGGRWSRLEPGNRGQPDLLTVAECVRCPMPESMRGDGFSTRSSSIREAVTGTGHN